MKRITRRVKALNERASELTASAAQLPQRVAELREAAQATSKELRSLKSGIQINVPDLLIKREDELGAALAEVAAHAPVFAEAGFILDGLDLEISPIQQIIVQLLHHRDAETLAIQPLIQRHQQQKYVRAILSAIVKAKAVVSTIEIDGLDYGKLSVAIGPVPTIRLCWRERPDEADPATTPPPAAESSPNKAATEPATSFFGTPPPLPPLHRGASSSASPTKAPAPTPEPDETTCQPPAQKEPDPSPEAPAPKEASVPQPEGPPPKQSQPPATPEDPLARFKVMPLKR